MRNSAFGSDLHQAESSSWLIMGSTMSVASGVVGDGEGDLEHAVVDEDDMRAVEREYKREGRRERQDESWYRRGDGPYGQACLT